MTTSERGPCSDINMTPLIDVLLVLLIVFIIAIPGATHRVTVDQRFSAKGAPTAAAVVDLNIESDGSLVWNRAVVDRGALQGAVSALVAKVADPEVHLDVDKFARYEIVAQTLADLQSRGVRRIEFVTAAERAR